MSKWKTILVTLCAVTILSGLLSFFITLLYMFFISRLSEVFHTIAFILVFLINPTIMVVLGYVYYAGKIKTKLWFNFLYFVVAFILAFVFSSIGFFILFNVGSTIS